MMTAVLLVLLMTACFCAGAAPFIRLRWWRGRPRLSRVSTQIKPCDVVIITDAAGDYYAGAVAGYNPHEERVVLITGDQHIVSVPVGAIKEKLL